MSRRFLSVTLASLPPLAILAASAFPAGAAVWHVDQAWAVMLFRVFATLGWAQAIASFLIDGVDVCGLRQVWFLAAGLAGTDSYGEASLFGAIPHPRCTAWLLATFSTAVMTWERLVLGLLIAAALLIAMHESSTAAAARRTVNFRISASPAETSRVAAPPGASCKTT